MIEKIINLPLGEEDINELKCGDNVLLNGIIYTARDSAHKKLMSLIDENKELPINIENKIIYYVGPTPAKPGQVIGSAGPTTSYRMDPYTPKLIQNGLRGIIGKGNIGNEVIESIIKNKGIYFASIGGAAALTAKCVVSSQIVAYEELGTEAIMKLEVKDLPLVVVVDAQGNNLYKIGPKKYLSTIK